MSLSRYTQQRRTFSLYIPKKPLSVILNNKDQCALPKLVIPIPGNNTSNENTSLQSIKSLNNNLSLKDKKQSSKPVVDNEVSKSISISANRYVLNEEIKIPFLPILPSPNDSGFDYIFTEKIKICTYMFDFNQPLLQLNGKKAKTEALTEINSLMSKKSDINLISSKQKQLLYHMIIRNIFDQDPFIADESIYLSTVKWSFIEPSWPHLSLVYSILIQYISSFPENQHINLIETSIRLMNIPDINENEILVSFLKNYIQIHSDQIDQIWDMIKNALLNVISNIYTPYCVEPIISFISTSIRPDCVSKIIRTHLLPLYKHEKLYIYSKSLTSFIIKIIDKDIHGQINAIHFLIKHFPHQCGQKQCLFVSSINSICEFINGKDLACIGKEMITFLGLIIKMPNMKLIESTLKLISTPSITKVFFKNTRLAMEKLYDPLNQISSKHWEVAIKLYAKKVLDLLMKINAEVNKNSSLLNLANSSRNTVGSNSNNNGNLVQKNLMKPDNKELIARWALIARAASKKDNSIDLTNSLLNIQANLLNEEKEVHEQYSLYITRPNNIPMNQISKINASSISN